MANKKDKENNAVKPGESNLQTNQPNNTPADNQTPKQDTPDTNESGTDNEAKLDAERRLNESEPKDYNMADPTTSSISR